jgi:hypothetical protein
MLFPRCEGCDKGSSGISTTSMDVSWMVTEGLGAGREARIGAGEGARTGAVEGAREGTQLDRERTSVTSEEIHRIIVGA